MKIEAMLHTIRAASGVSNCNNFLVIGSQAVLGHCRDRDIDFEFWESFEIDLVPLPDKKAIFEEPLLINEKLSDLLDGSIGEESIFHQNFGYYVHGVGLKTANFPTNWQKRTITINIDSVNVVFPSIEDLFIAKCIANRDKDKSFIQKLIDEDMVDFNKLENICESLKSIENYSELKKRINLYITKTEIVFRME